ncbi:MAG: XylR N-terminal domain-containing protein, partial [Myxococcota bacterium]
MELDRSLAEDPRFLGDEAFLAALRRELVARLGPLDAATALLQLGFVHGLRDATRVVALEGSLGALPTHPTASRIAMR